MIEEPKKINRTPLIVAIIVLLLCCVLGVVLSNSQAEDRQGKIFQTSTVEPLPIVSIAAPSETVIPTDTPVPTSTIDPYKDWPEDATAKCKDGTYSNSKNKSGTCSGHKGVLSRRN
jgi:hypothetical protein